MGAENQDPLPNPIACGILVVILVQRGMFIEFAVATGPQSGIGWFASATQSGIAVPIGSMPSSAKPDQGAFERRLTTLVNDARAQRGLMPLRSDKDLHRAADAHVKDMAKSRALSFQDEQGGCRSNVPSAKNTKTRRRFLNSSARDCQMPINFSIYSLRTQRGRALVRCPTPRNRGGV